MIKKARDSMKAERETAKEKRELDETDDWDEYMSKPVLKKKPLPRRARRKEEEEKKGIKM